MKRTRTTTAMIASLPHAGRAGRFRAGVFTAALPQELCRLVLTLADEARDARGDFVFLFDETVRRASLARFDAAQTAAAGTALHDDDLLTRAIRARGDLVHQAGWRACA